MYRSKFIYYLISLTCQRILINSGLIFHNYIIHIIVS